MTAVRWRSRNSPARHGGARLARELVNGVRALTVSLLLALAHGRARVWRMYTCIRSSAAPYVYVSAPRESVRAFDLLTWRPSAAHRPKVARPYTHAHTRARARHGSSLHFLTPCRRRRRRRCCCCRLSSSSVQRRGCQGKC